MRRSAPLPCLVLSLFFFAAFPAIAEPDVFGAGSGVDGNVTLSAPNTRVNQYAALTQARQPGDTTLAVSSTANLNAQDLLMVHSPGGLLPPAAGDSAEINLGDVASGRWEFAVIARVESSTQLVLTAPLSHAYPAAGAQIIRVPQYQNLTVEAGASIVAKYWDGASGGVIAFLVKGTFTHQGTVNATSAGFRGGQFINHPGVQSGCTDLNQAGPAGAQKGEGIADRVYGPDSTGRGNLANAGGGGNCHNTGGGGGGHGGSGGRGGDSFAVPGGAPTAALGGLGGTSLQSSLLTRLTFGGGGGAGHGNDATGTNGGRGGGAILVRAQAVVGNGVFSARGASVPDIVGYQGDGGGGGGAGGSISLRAFGNIQCQLLSAKGGNGGSILGASSHGPGGGGGGGKVLVQAGSIQCGTEVTAGLAGVEAMGSHFGATPADSSATPYVGDLEIISSGLVIPGAPTVTQPFSGYATKVPTLTLAGSAAPGATVVVFHNHAEVLRVMADGAGLWTTSPAVPLQDGAHVLYAHTESRELFSGRSNSVQVTVDATPPAPPVISKPTLHETVGPSFRALSGTAEPASKVTLTLDGQVIAELLTANDGGWQFDLTAALTEGPHQLRAQARDALNNVSEATVHPFTADAQPADTQILKAPHRITSARHATFEFTSEDPTATFECSLDGQPFHPCVSPATWEKLSFDSHVFAVRSVDPAGNADPSPAEHRWIVDLMGGGLACSCSSAPPASAWMFPLLWLALARLPRRRRFFS